MAKSYEERIAETKQRIEQDQNRMNELVQKQKKEERNTRTKRLCSRMRLIESMLPDTVSLTEDQFKIFLEKTMCTDYCRRTLDELMARNTNATMPKSTDMVLEGGEDEGSCVNGMH